MAIKVGIIGCVLRGLVASARRNVGNPRCTFTASVRSDNSLSRLLGIFDEQRDRVKVVQGDAARIAKDTDVILLGPQPNDLESILKDREFSNNAGDKIIVSMVAGVAIETISKAISPDNEKGQVCRAIPTIGASIGDSVTLLTKTPDRDHATRDVVEALFKDIGGIHYVPEALMNSATALSAACHALAIEAVEAATDSGVASGIPRDVAKGIAARCFQSAGNVLAHDMTPESMKAAMSTPSGITLNSTVRLGPARTNISDTVRFAIAYANGMSSSD